MMAATEEFAFERFCVVRMMKLGRFSPAHFTRNAFQSAISHCAMRLHSRVIALKTVPEPLEQCWNRSNEAGDSLIPSVRNSISVRVDDRQTIRFNTPWN